MSRRRSQLHSAKSLPTQRTAATFEAAFPLLGETPDIYPIWKALVGALGVVGKQVHDARLVAVCHVHVVTHLLTFNVSHFARMAGFGPVLSWWIPQPCEV